MSNTGHFLKDFQDFSELTERRRKLKGVDYHFPTYKLDKGGYFVRNRPFSFHGKGQDGGVGGGIQILTNSSACCSP